MPSRSEPPGGGDTTLSRLVASAVAHLRKKLLDLTLRNRLLNFKFTETSRKFVRVIDEVPDRLFASLTDESSIPIKLFFRALPEPEEADPTEATGTFKAALEEARFTDDQYQTAITSNSADQQPQLLDEAERTLRDRVGTTLGVKASRGKPKVDLATWARQNSIDPAFDLPAASPQKPSHSDKFIQTLLFPDALERKVSGLREDARLAQQELGLSTLFAAFGYLEWFESADSQQPLFAPLVLLPVEIDRELKYQRYQYFVQSGAGQDAVINLTLKERLLQDFNVVVPEFDEEDTPESYFRKVQLAISEHKRWKIRRFVVIGHFSFSRLVMYEDLDPDRWAADPPHEQSLVREILAGSESTEANTYADDYDVDNPDVERLVPFLVTDADSSQFSALVDAMSGRSFALQGPPGTGKSQTITNLIATALATNKSILFVAEKMAALEVVAKRLREAGLGPFLLELHSTKIQKKRLLESFSERLKIADSGRTQLDQKYQNTLERLRQVRDEIRRYLDLLNNDVGNSEMTLHHAYWREQRARDALSVECRLELEELAIPGAHELTAAKIGERVALLRQYARQLERTASQEGIPRHPLYGINRPGHSSFDVPRLESALRNLGDRLEQLLAILTRFEAGFRVALPRELTSCKAIVDEILAVPDPTSDVDFGVLSQLRAGHSPEELHTSEQSLAKLVSFVKPLAAAFRDPDLALANHAEIHRYAISLDHLLDTCFSTDDSITSAISSLDQEEKRVADAVRVIQQLEQFSRIANVAFPTNTAEAAIGLVEAVELISLVEPEVLDFRHDGLVRASAVSRLEALSKQAIEIQEELAALSARFDLGLLPGAETLQQAADTCERIGSIAYWLGRSGARIRRQYKRCARGASASKQQIEADFKSLSSVLTRKVSFERDISLKALAGPWSQGLDTPFERLKSAAEFFQKAIHRFSVLDPIRGAIQRALITVDGELLRALRAMHLETIRSSRQVFARHWPTSIPFADTLNSHLKDVGTARTALTALGQVSVSPDVALSEVLAISRQLNDVAEIRHRTLAVDWLKLSRPMSYDPSKDLKRIAATSDYFARLHKAVIPHELREAFLADNGHSKLILAKQFASLLAASIQTLEQLRGRLATEFDVEYSQAFGGRFEGDAALHSLRDEVARAIGLRPEVTIEWINYQMVAKHVDALGLQSIASVVNRHRLSADDSESSYLYVHLRNLIERCVSTHPELPRWTGLHMDKLRQELVRLDREYMDVSRRSVYDNVRRKHVPIGRSQGPAAAITEKSLIEREAAKQRRHIPIRTLLQRAGAAAKALKPCFMMSPASVSQFLAAEAGQFDIVVIDEASQMRPEEAICAISRGKQAFIVGDPMQLPPTSFFDSSQDTAVVESEDELDVDTESILDRAISALRPIRDLKWHYRSKHHSLIDFSNREFYQDRLVVFPSPTRHGPQLGVTLIPVDAGAYKASINPLEADTVVQTVCSLIRLHPDRSIGVVSINQPQKDLLVERFDRAFADSDELDSYRQRWDETLEPFFVKNLENVQGDERDIIVISTVYGPEQPGGPVHQRFGPINTNVGHRRLNVLFTRAKERVVLVSTLKAEDIVITASSKLGVKALKGYLEYARSGRLERGHSVGDDFESPFEYQVASLLRASGLEVASQVGVAGYRIDLAVRSRANCDHFILGIECDGATYHSAKSARDRDRLRQEVLERLGWRLYRIWSTDWFNSREREAARLLQEIEVLQSQYDVSVRKVPVVLESAVVQEDQDNSHIGAETPDSEITLEDARDVLIDLRSRIWKEQGSGPSADGILRKSMIDAFLINLPLSIADVENTMGDLWASVGATQRQYLTQVLSILAKVDRQNDPA